MLPVFGSPAELVIPGDASGSVAEELPGGTGVGIRLSRLPVFGSSGGGDTASGAGAEIRSGVLIPGRESCAFSVEGMDIIIGQIMIKIRKITPNMRLLNSFSGGLYVPEPDGETS